MLAPTNLQPPVVNHETLQVTQCVKRRGRRWINECDKTDVLIRNVADVMQKSTSNDITNLFDSRLGVNVS